MPVKGRRHFFDNSGARFKKNAPPGYWTTPTNQNKDTAAATASNPAAEEKTSTEPEPVTTSPTNRSASPSNGFVLVDRPGGEAISSRPGGLFRPEQEKPAAAPEQSAANAGWIPWLFGK